tara:strand:- start:6987 stop:8099 length:1113 start_codon:yes stop_codon:yes gene_type:complete
MGNFFGVMSILSGFVCLLLAGFLLAVPTVRRMPNTFLAVFLTLTAIELSGWLWVTPATSGSLANALRLAVGSLQMPVFLGLFVSTCYSDFRFKLRDALHLIPFAVALFLSLPGSQIPFGAGAGADAHLTHGEMDLIWMGAHIQYYGYMIGVIAVLWQFRKLFREHYSGARSEVLIWLTQLAAVSFFAHTLILVRNLLTYSPASNLAFALQVLGAILALAITTWIALKSLFQPQLFRDVDRGLVDLAGSKAGASRKADAANPELGRLLAFMTTNEPYLDSELSLAALSDQIAMTPREVSELVNQSLGLHFFDFVNGYRVRKAQELLLATPRRSVLEVLYTVGFNSKSSFNTAFKKHAGMTPSAYRSQAALG